MKRRNYLEASTDRVHGNLLQWAREQQGLTMRYVNEQGGPSLGYQSEVERAIKQEVSSDVLAVWVRILQVTTAFARGQVPQYRENPAGCAGMARAVALAIAAGRTGRHDWKEMNPEERMQGVLRLIPLESPALPRVVLAHVLGVAVATLDEIMLGNHPIMREPARAIVDLTALPDTFWVHGEVNWEVESDPLAGYITAIRLADQFGITPEEMYEWVVSHRPGSPGEAR